MAHRPVVIPMQVITHLPTLPYRWALDEFVTHTHHCEPCAEAFAQDESECTDFCPEGHLLFHAVSESITRQNAASLRN